MIVTPGNGFSFDAAKYATKLLVTRKDNGASVTVTQINDTTYSFKMPGEGVDVRAIFDARPFVITMRCYDEVGNSLTGKGLWQVAINLEPGVVDNDPSLTQTQFTVAYEDYVTVAMTEAGWSNYDMVSFRVDGQEYVAEVLNYFYNFQMIEERAKDLDIVAVLRPRVPSSPTVHSLNAVYDATKGNVEFILLDKDPVTGAASATNYASNVNGTNYYATVSSGVISNARYTKSAFAGDYVAILAQSDDDKYNIDLDSISIVPYYSDANRIVPTKLTGWTINGDNNGGAGYTLYVFKMPDSDLGITVSFTGTKQAIYISVLDMDGNPVNGMVRLFANNIYRDVATDGTFDDIAYKTQVQVLRSELAVAESKIISAVDIVTAGGKPITYMDMSNAGEGIWFTMPDESVWIIVKIDDFHYNAPTFAMDTQVYNGSLTFRKNPNLSDPVVSLSDFSIGDVVYVYQQPYDGYDYLDVGDLKVFVNGVNNGANLDLTATAAAGYSVWKFTLPAGTIVFQASFPEKTPSVAQITVSTNPAGSAVDISVDGVTQRFSDTDTFYAYEGQTIKVSSATDGHDIVGLDSADSGITTYVVPEGVTAKTLMIYLTSSQKPITKVNLSNGDLQFSSGSDMTALISKQTYGQTVYVLDLPDAGYELDQIKILDNATGLPVALTELTPSATNPAKWSFTMPGEGVTAGATFKAKTFTVKFSMASLTAPVSVNAGGSTYTVGDAQTITVSYGETITVTLDSGYVWDTNAMTVSTGSVTGTGNTSRSWKIPDLSADTDPTVTIYQKTA